MAQITMKMKVPPAMVGVDWPSWPNRTYMYMYVLSETGCQLFRNFTVRATDINCYDYDVSDFSTGWANMSNSPIQSFTS